MASLRQLFYRLLNAIRPWRAESDLDQELAAHLRLLEDDFLRRGLSLEEARLAATRALGVVARAKDLHRDARSFVWMDNLRGDLRYAVRTLRRSPGFTAVAVCTLALGIGANTAIFSLVNAIILRSLPVRHPEQLVELLEKYPRDPWLNLYRWTDYERFRDQNHVFSDLIAMAPEHLQVTDSTLGAELVDGAYVSGNFFEALGLHPAIGRLIGPPDDHIGSVGAAVSVISWSFWENRFNLDPTALGKPLVVNNVSTRIIGVTARGFFGLQLGMDPSVWLPVSIEPLIQKPSHLGDNWHWQNFSLVGRLKSGVTIEQAQAEMRVLNRPRLADLEAQTHDVQWRDVPMDVEPAGAGLSVLRERFSSSLRLMMAAVSVLLVLACLNVASLLVARGAARHREMAVRVALGAGRFRLVRQVLTESLLLSMVGGTCGVFVAYVGAHALVTFIASGRSPVGMPQPLQIPVQIDRPVLLFAAGASVVTGVLFGLVPAWRAFVWAPSSSMRDVGGAAQTGSWRWIGQGLVVAQVALSMILLSAAILFVRHLTDLRTVGLGFQTQAVLQVRLDWSRSGYTPEQRKFLSQQLLGRIAAIGGVRLATLAAMTPISGTGGSQFISVPDFTEDPEDRRRVRLNGVTPKYFDTLGTPFIAGRDFAPEDEGRPPVAIVNQALARYYFGASNALGRHFSVEGEADPFEIVGVVGDAKYNNVHETPPRTAYMNAFQGSGGGLTFMLLRTVVPPRSVVSNVRRAMRDLLPTVPIANVTTLAEQVDASILPERLIAMLSELFGVLAALLIGIGLYGLLAYTVTRRTHEIGIRVAIGASRGEVSRMVLTDALRLVVAGLIIGMPIAVVAKGYASSVLALLATAQAEAPVILPSGHVMPIVFTGLALMAVAFAASYLPARRATQIEPVVALRCE